MAPGLPPQSHANLLQSLAHRQCCPRMRARKLGEAFTENLAGAGGLVTAKPADLNGKAEGFASQG